MANPKKSKREEKVVEAGPVEEEDMDDSEEDGDSGDESSSAGEDDDMLNAVVTVDFDAFPPDDSDFHGIKKLLLQVFRNAHINVSDLANHLIELNKLSVVLRQSDEDMQDDEDDDDMDDDDGDVFGVGGLLPLSSEREGMKGVKKFLLEQAKGPVRSELEDIFSTGRVGFLLSERFINIPPRIAVPLLKSINEDWKKMPKSNKAFDFTHLVMICKQYKGADSLLYANGEEELFVDLADFKFSYEVPQGDADTAIAGKWKEGDEELKQARQVLILDAKKLPEMIRLVEENV